MAMYDVKGFYDWANSNPGAGQIRQYGETYGYSPAQMANIYNQGGGNAAGSSVTAEQAGQWLGGVDPNQRLGNYWNTAQQDPQTGQYSDIGYGPTDSQNYSNWGMTTPTQTSSTGSSNTGDTTGSTGGLADLFQPNLYSNSSSYGSSGSVNNSNSNSLGLSNSFNGLDPQYRNAIASGVLPQLLSAVAGLNNVPGQTAQAAQSMYGNLSRQALEQSMPDILNQLASRGVLNSSVGSDAISNSANTIIPQFANAGYQSQIDAGKMQMQIPNILGTLMGLGNFNTSEGTNLSNSTSSGLSSATNTSQSSDPLEPYQLLSNFLMGY